MSLIKRTPTSDLTRWNSEFPAFRGLLSLQHDMNRIVDEFFRGDLLADGGFSRRDWYPAVDITENAERYVLNAELPGMAKEDVQVTLENNVLTIRGEKKGTTEEKQGDVHRIERRFGSFERSFTLPSTVDVNKIDAQYKDGVLSLTLPKAEEAKPRAIDVKVR
ncbi:MAG: Hsp20/alpha crystallin family protein [Bacteroidetes bacterium]|nr:Hsp20/alpha crystallin family protein [Bacteroidota bacterium]